MVFNLAPPALARSLPAVAAPREPAAAAVALAAAAAAAASAVRLAAALLLLMIITVSWVACAAQAMAVQSHHPGAVHPEMALHVVQPARAHLCSGGGLVELLALLTLLLFLLFELLLQGFIQDLKRSSGLAR